MKLQELKSFEIMNLDSLSFIVGGTASDSRRNDSKSQDCKKKDEFKIEQA